MAVKSSVLQSVAKASYEAPLAKIKQSQMLLGGGTFITSLFFYNNLYLVWVGKGKEGKHYNTSHRDHTAFYSVPSRGLDVIRRVN